MIGKDDIFGIPIESRELKTYTTGCPMSQGDWYLSHMADSSAAEPVSENELRARDQHAHLRGC